jgi:hypothetical protein
VVRHGLGERCLGQGTQHKTEISDVQDLHVRTRHPALDRIGRWQGSLLLLWKPEFARAKLANKYLGSKNQVL